jgi:hypothetical protein
MMQRIMGVVIPKRSQSARATRLIRLAVRAGGVAGVIGALILLGWLAPRIPTSYLLLATVLVLAVILVLPRLGRLEVGVLAILLAAGFVRFKLPTGTHTEIVASLASATAVVALWLVKMLAEDRNIYLKPALTNIPLLGFMFTCVVAYVWGNAFRDVLVMTWGTFPFVQLAALLVMIMLPAVFLLVSNSIEDVKWLERMSWILIFIGALTVIFLVFPIPVGKSFVLRLVGASGVGIGLLSLWVVSVAYGLALFNRRMALWMRLLLLGLVALWMYYGTGRLMGWMSIWLPPLCAIFVISFMRSKRLFLALVLVALVYAGANFDRLYQRIYVQSVEEGDFQRWELWQTNLELVSNHPLFGTGPAGYAVYYMTYHPENARSTHNNYFDVIAQTGIVGFALFLWFFGALGIMGYKLCVKLRGQRSFKEAFACGRLGGYVGALVAMMLGDWLLPFVYNVGLEGFDHAVYAWLFLGGLAALHHIVEKHEDDRPTTVESAGGA